ncbi:MAG: L-lactate dehydrogenase [Nitrospirae bacterium]|jgi:L-lactate dehydrogenase|nr:L-lactate dehydrogenase [Nitrospirota bacterium]
MNNETWKARKIVIVGAGAVGSTFAFALAQHGMVNEIAITDMNKELVKGQVLDLMHGNPFFPSVDIYEGENIDYSNADIIVITAGVKMLSSNESRLSLLQKNKSIIEGIIDEIIKQKSKAIIIIVSNPVDVLTYVAWKRSGWERNRIIGSGTVLDSSRLRYLLSKKCGIDVHNVHAYVLGEHGDSEFAAWSMAHIGGIPINSYCSLCGLCTDYMEERRKIEDIVRNSAYHIIDYKGATYFGIAMALLKIVSAIIRNEKSILTVSTVLQGEYGLSNVSLGVPVILSRLGMERIIETKLTPEEQSLLEKSASILKSSISELVP